MDSLETKFHRLLIEKKFEQFNCITNQIDKKLFEEFLNSDYLEQIKTAFISQRRTHYFYNEAIADFYCELCYHTDSDDIDDKTEVNIDIIEQFLCKIKDKVLRSILCLLHVGLSFFAWEKRKYYFHQNTLLAIETLWLELVRRPRGEREQRTSQQHFVW